LRALRQFEGYPDIKDWHLKLIRKKANLIYRRNHGLSDDDLEKALALIRTDLESSLITQWGYRSVQNHLRIAYDLFVSRRTVNTILRELNPIALKARAPYCPRRCRRYIVKGPNRV